MEKYIDLLYELVMKSNELNEIPVGAIIIKDDQVIGKGYNNRQTECDVCGHAEINAIREAEKYLNDWRLNGCILLTTLFPCDLCQSAIKEARIDDVFYLFDGKEECNNRFKKLDFIHNEKVKKMGEIFNNFFINLR